MRKIFYDFLISIIFFTHAGLAAAYEVDTHQDMSENALNTSNLSMDTSVLSNLGLLPLTSKQKFPNSKSEAQNIIELIRTGAKFEDDVTLVNPRPLNHFFNPLTNAALTVGIALGSASPDWALEDTGVIGNQDFSYRDARQYFYDALTKGPKAEREKNFGLTFQTLGQVIHHIQDMAQPQHVRNDAHLAAPIVGNPSAYERYTNDVRSGLPFSGYAPVYSGTDTATFNKPRNFWTTSTGKGLAQFTNLNFVSAGTNFDNPGMFNSPPLDPSLRNDKDFQQLCAEAGAQCPNTNLSGIMTFYGNWVQDDYTGDKKLNLRASTESIFSPDLEKTYSKKVFALNSFNFRAAHDFLIPRAVAYSAGLINYFFRGKIDFVPDTVYSDKYVIKNLGPEDMQGTFTLYYDDINDLRGPVTGAEWTLSIPKNGQSAPVSFTPPVNPQPKKDGSYILVFRGDMGNEKASSEIVGAVAAVTLQDPGFIVIAHYSSPYTGGDILHGSRDGGYQFERLNLATRWLGDLAYYPDTGAMVPYAHAKGRAIYLGGKKALALDSPAALSAGTIVYKYANGSWDGGAATSGLDFSAGDPVYLGGNTFIVRSYYPLPPTSNCPIPGAHYCLPYAPALFRSGDGGVSWGFLSAPMGYENIEKLAYLGKNKLVSGKLVPDPTGGDTLLINAYVSMMGTSDHRFLRSVDGGMTWSQVGFPSEMTYSGNSSWTLTDFAYAGKGIVYALFFSTDNATGSYASALFKTRDAGDTWYKVGPLSFLGPNDYPFRLIFAGDNGAVPGRYP